MNGTIITGKSADGSDAQVAEGVHDYGQGQWGTTEPKLSEVGRMYNAVMDHIKVMDRTLEEEFTLIEQKKSQLSKRLRDFVVVVVAMNRAEKEDSIADGKVNQQV